MTVTNATLSSDEILNRRMRYEFQRVPSRTMCGSSRTRILGLRLNGSQGLHPRSKPGIAVTVKRCSDCGLIFSDPMPHPDKLDDHYEVSPEEYWSSSDALSWEPEYFRTEIETAKRLLPFKSGMRALDIGAGLGKGMRSMTSAGFDSWGIEPSETFHRQALANVSADRLALAALENAQFDEQRFDFITFGAVLEHLFDPSASLQRALELAAPGAIIYVEVPSSDWLIPKFVNLYCRLLGTTLTTHISPMHSPYHLYEFTIESFRRNGARLGYEIAEHRVEVCSVIHSPKLAKPLLHWIMDRTGRGMQLVMFLRSLRPE